MGKIVGIQMLDHQLRNRADLQEGFELDAAGRLERQNTTEWATTFQPNCPCSTARPSLRKAVLIR